MTDLRELPLALRNLETIKKELGLTWEEIAQKIEVPYRTLVSWYQRGTDPRSSDLAIIAKKLRVSLDWLVLGRRGGEDTANGFLEIMRYLSEHPEKIPVLLNLFGLESAPSVTNYVTSNLENDRVKLADSGISYDADEDIEPED